MIENISKEIVKIINIATFNDEILSENTFFHIILLFLLKKLKENRKISGFYINKTSILPYFQDLTKISKVFPFIIIISDEYPVENDEFQCILQKYQEKYSKNVKNLYKFMKKYKLHNLQQKYEQEDLRFTLISNNIQHY